MTAQLSLFSEPFAPTGAMAAKGLKEALGRPGLDTLVLLVREAVQNSWDARIPDNETILFDLEARTVEGLARKAWRAALASWPSEGLPLVDVMARSRFDVLFVSDRGTTGLMGPTRADQGTSGGSRDFVDFMRNVGQPRDTHLGGGTYGYGKSVFFVASEASTIITYTRIQIDGHFESRLMGAALGDNHENDGRPFTGRHWWGEVRDGVIEPIEGHRADEIAESLGFPSFRSGETGTTIAVIGFYGLDDEGNVRDLAESCAVMAEAITWYCWPKFGVTGRADQISFGVEVNAEIVPIPDETDFPVLRLFRAALKAALGGNAADSANGAFEIRSQRPKKLLGTMGIEKGLHKQGQGSSLISPLSGNAHHVALMRSPLLIVKYEPGTPFPSDQLEWAGAFVVDPTVDDAFARAEPPAHDNWISAGLDRPDKIYVNVAVKRIRETVDEQLVIGRHAQSEATRVPLGALSNRLGSLLALAPGTGARSGGRPERQKPSGASSSHRQAGVVTTEGPELVIHEGKRALRVGFRARPPVPSLLAVVPSVIVDAGRPEGEPPLGAEEPILLALTVDGAEMSDSEPVRISTTVEGTVIVSVPDDTMVRVDLSLKEEDAD